MLRNLNFKTFIWIITKSSSDLLDATSSVYTWFPCFKQEKEANEIKKEKRQNNERLVNEIRNTASINYKCIFWIRRFINPLPRNSPTMKHAHIAGYTRRESDICRIVYKISGIMEGNEIKNFFEIHMRKWIETNWPPIYLLSWGFLEYGYNQLDKYCRHKSMLDDEQAQEFPRAATKQRWNVSNPLVTIQLEKSLCYAVSQVHKGTYRTK